MIIVTTTFISILTKILVFHLPKFWSFICQKIGLSFAKKLVIIRQKIGHHSPKNWSSFAKKLVFDCCDQKIGL